VRFGVGHPSTRAALNAIYNRLSWENKEVFQNRFSWLFRQVPRVIAPGNWTVRFAGKELVLPLTTDGLWLEWALALCSLGHETEIKKTYERLIRSPRPPKCVVDIGANYGGHSLLFLIHGIPTISIEPNPNCHDYFRRAAELNRVTCDIRPVALGNAETQVELWFPKTETWLGSICPEVKERLEQRTALDKVLVRQTTLDHLLEDSADRPDLIKIDTEGNELPVLQGAAKTLERYKPMIIIESWCDESRAELFHFFDQAGYGLFPLPVPLLGTPHPVDLADYLQHPATNWIAANRARGLPF
jgi:FkbM family methyltransferase